MDKVCEECGEVGEFHCVRCDANFCKTHQETHEKSFKCVLCSAERCIELQEGDTCAYCHLVSKFKVLKDELESKGLWVDAKMMSELSDLLSRY